MLCFMRKPSSMRMGWLRLARRTGTMTAQRGFHTKQTDQGTRKILPVVGSRANEPLIIPVASNSLYGS
jgi:hypothetical protein